MLLLLYKKKKKKFYNIGKYIADVLLYYTNANN